jgi:hypothetical protein
MGNHNYFGPYLLESPFTYNFFLTRISSTGDVMWARIIKERGQNWQSRQIGLDAEGSCYIGGNLRDSTWFENIPVAPQGKYDLFTAKYDEAGNFEWSKVFGSNPLNLYENYYGMNYLHGIAVYDSNSIFVGGSFTNDLQLDGTILNSSGVNGFISLLGNEVPPVPVNREVFNVTVDNGQTACFNATATITVAGNGTAFRVENGGDANFIAGHDILFRSGTRVTEGGHLWGHITTSGNYCETTLNPLTASLKETDETSSVKENRSGAVKLFPNPTSGLLNLEFPSPVSAAGALVTIYNMNGKQILRQEVRGETRHTFSLAGEPAGIYLVRVILEGKMEIVKVIRNQ